jgi:hypothetical protein
MDTTFLFLNWQIIVAIISSVLIPRFGVAIHPIGQLLFYLKGHLVSEKITNI